MIDLEQRKEPVLWIEPKDWREHFAQMRLMWEMLHNLSDRVAELSDALLMSSGVMGQNLTPLKTAEEKREVLENSAPKIADERKFHGPSADDVNAIAKRRRELFGS